MRISREWLQKYFEKPLPEAAALADALTFHAFEIESVEPSTPLGSGNDWILDVKVTPNRGHDCLSHRGIAKELSAILELPMSNDPFRQSVKLEPQCIDISIQIDEPSLCPRFIACHITGVSVGPSPDWLRHHLESIGQRSINNIVDATNFVMLDLGQPLHAFDASKLKTKNSKLSLTVRKAKEGERLVGLDDKAYALTSTMLIIADSATDKVVSIAGIKGGKSTGVDESTTSIFLEAANWDGVTIRKTSQALKLRTDASQRFEQVISPELAAYGIRAAADLIVQIACGKTEGFIDEYPIAAEKRQVTASTAEINSILGASLSDKDVANALTRLGLSHIEAAGVFTVHEPLERLDLSIPEDIAEEVGRIIGYDKIAAAELPALPKSPLINQQFYAAEQVREELMQKGYTEVYTSVFAEKGERFVANKVDGVRPALRSTLIAGLADAYERNDWLKDLLGLSEVKLFEVGTVWKDGEPARPDDSGRSGGEMTMVGMVDRGGAREHPLVYRGDASIQQYDDLPLSKTTRYEPFSKYPAIVRDIAMWVPSNTSAEAVLAIIRGSAGELLVRSEKFDEFTKGERVSYAFHLVFQSFDRTLTDFDANGRMESISDALKARGFEIR